VTSSNTAPRDLYQDACSARFLPAIALLQQHCAVVQLLGATDYRLRALTRTPVYRALAVLGDAEESPDAWLMSRWKELSAGCAPDAGPLEIDGRLIPARALAEGHAWFDFGALCEGPRAAGDYIEIATEYHTVLLGGIQRSTAAGRCRAPLHHPGRRLYDRTSTWCAPRLPPAAALHRQQAGRGVRRTHRG
jgi:cell division protein ZapE